MIKRIVWCFIFFFALPVLYGQNAAISRSQLDDAVKTLAADLQKTIPTREYSHVSLGQWTYRYSVPPLGLYWAAQLRGELAGIAGRDFGVETDISGLTGWLVSGEIVEIPGAIRVYTRLIHYGSREIEASFYADFDLNEDLAEMLAGGGSGRSGNSPLVVRDGYEPDSPHSLPEADIAADASGPVISRTIHAEDDEDFFLLTTDTDRNGTLIMETTGEDIDTYMELYGRGSERKLAENDDGGSGVNARIRHEVRAGTRAFFVKVRGYDGDTGNYGFRAWFVEAAAPDEYEDDNDFETAKEIRLGTAQRHTFTTGNDVDWVKFQIDRDGLYAIRARGVNSTRLDTSIVLYDSDQNAIEADDDGGEDYDSRLSVRLRAGTYSLKVECLDNEPEEPYTISVERED
jgi:hypothetical protein